VGIYELRYFSIGVRSAFLTFSSYI